MFVRYMDDQELRHYAERVSKWVTEREKGEIVEELERRRPVGAMRIEEARRVARKQELAEQKQALEGQWILNGCVQDSSSGRWIVPYELIWRSLPHGEDR